MKKFLLILCMLLMASTQADAKAGLRGGVQTSSTTPLIGISVDGLEFGTPTSPNAAEYAYYRSKNLNIARVPFDWNQLQPTLGSAFNTTYLGYLQNQLTYANANGMCVILDAHNFGNRTAGTLGTGFTQAQFAAFWGLMAQTFNGSAGLCGYELMNEPYQSSSSTQAQQSTDWQNAFQAAITALRAYDTTTPIYIDGFWFATSFAWTTYSNNFYQITDPNNHLNFAAHAYADRDSSGTHYDWATEVAAGDQLTVPVSAIDTNILVKRLTPFVTWCKAHTLNCVAGETGVPSTNVNWMLALQNAISYVQSNGVPFLYFAAGPNWGTYPFSVEPNSDGSDALQMAYLTKFSGALQPQNAYIYGPTRGTAGSPSTSFTVNYQGSIPSTFTVTPSDGGAGGTFTPSSVSIGAGMNGSGTFTYTSSGSQTVALSATPSYNYLFNYASGNFGYSTQNDQFLNASITPVNAYGLRKIYAPYIGPLVNLRRASDNATRDFYATGLAVNSPVNVSAITTWAAGSNIYLVKWYDQSPNANHLLAPYSNDAPLATPTTAAQPQMILSCQNSLPCFYFNGANGMEAQSGVNGNTAQTVMAVYEPTSHFGQGSLIDWVFCCGQTSLNYWNGDMFTASNMGSTLRAYTIDNAFAAVASTFNTSSAIGMNQYTNGALVGQAVVSGSAVNYPYRSVLMLGWQAFTSNYFTGYLSELVVHNANITNAQIASFQSDQMTYWGITGFPAFSWPTPTLNQSTSAANTPPWKGVNEGGLGFGYNFDSLPVTAAQTYYANRGMNVVRFPVEWAMLQKGLCTGDTTINSTELSKLDSTISMITAAGMDVLIDLHNYGNYNYNYWSTCASPPDNGNISNTTTQGYFANFWGQIAARYASNPKVKFDLMNEPNAVTATQNAVASQAAINAIRTAGANQYIFVEGGGSYADCRDVAANSGPAFLTLTDSQNKLIAECHGYFDSGNSGSSDVAATGAGLNRVTSATTYAQAHNIKLFLGEFGIGFTPSMYVEGKAALDYIAANMDSGSGGWVGWTAWGGGPNWSENYWYAFEPRATNYSPVVTPLIDRPMMRFLSTYATGGTWGSGQFP